MCSTENEPILPDLSGLRFVDLSMPIQAHWRFTPEFGEKLIPTPEFTFHSTIFSMGAHGFSHVDAPYHVDPEAARILDMDPTGFYGPAAVIDLSDLGDDAAVDDTVLRDRSAHVRPGDMLLLRSDHGLRHPTTTSEFWTCAPHLTASGARFLLTLQVKATGFDFPQDRGIRGDYVPEFVPSAEPIEDWACHTVLVPAGVTQIEYLCAMDQLTADRVLLFAVPIALSDADGAPARVYALETR